MGFMESYKHLDNLCKDMNGIGVTGYITDMENEQLGDRYISSWKSDYYTLKHYRHIRNQIAHDNYASEDNLCSAEDQKWIEEFYERIMRQSDPLARYYMIKQGKNVNRKGSTNNRTFQNSTPKRQFENRSVKRVFVLIFGILIIVLLRFYVSTL